MRTKDQMTLSAVQKQVDQWINQFEEGYWSPLANLARLTEEVGELAREVNHQFGEKPKKADEPEGSVAEELGDILFVVICLANALDLSLEQVFAQVMTKVEERDGNRWTRKGAETLEPDSR